MSAAQYDPNKLGWGAALVTCALTAALGFGAYTIHNNTYRHPRDPMATQVYHERDNAKHAAPAASHGEAAPAAEGHTADTAAAKPAGTAH